MTSSREKILLRFATVLSSLRRQRGMSIRQLAARSALEYSLVQRIEKGRVNFAFSTLVALAYGLDMELSDLLDAYRLPR